MDGAFDVPADRQFLRNDATLHLCAFRDHNSRGAKLTLDLTENGQRPVADNLADNRKAGTDRGVLGRRRGCNGGAWSLLR
jgi:hypothetical protein